MSEVPLYSLLVHRARAPWRAEHSWSTHRAARHLPCAFLSDVDFSLSVFLCDLDFQEHRRILRRRSVCPVRFNGEDPSNPNNIMKDTEPGICTRGSDSEHPRKQQSRILEQRTLCYFSKRRTHVDLAAWTVHGWSRELGIFYKKIIQSKPF